MIVRTDHVVSGTATPLERRLTTIRTVWAYHDSTILDAASRACWIGWPAAGWPPSSRRIETTSSGLGGNSGIYVLEGSGYLIVEGAALATSPRAPFGSWIGRLKWSGRSGFIGMGGAWPEAPLLKEVGAEGELGFDLFGLQLRGVEGLD